MTWRDAAIAVVTAALAAQGARADKPIEDIEDLSLRDLLNADTTVASSKATPLRETPGVVTIVTRDEIQASGARDLIDVLALVPGFTFGVDVLGAVDVSFRGNWAHEGKVLLLYDGQEMNETLYLTLELGNHFPIDNIDRIEIIRGPGSALYGGYAELGVINIVTRKGGDIQGLGGWGEYGQQRLGYGRRDAGVFYGQKYTGVLDGLSVSIDAMGGQGNRSDGVYLSDTGAGKRLVGIAANDPAFVDVGIGYKGLDVRLIADDYRTTTIDGYGSLLSSPATEAFIGLFGDVRYELKLGDTLTVSPRFQAKRQYPWNAVGTAPDTVADLFYNKSADRLKGGLTLSWDIVPKLNFILGDEVTYDYAQRLATPPGGEVPNTTFAGKGSVQYWNEAAFAQVLLQTVVVNVTAGARFEYHQQFGPSFVPRVALTKAFDRLSLKLLVSGAFKAPGIENINVNPTIAPERTRVYEAEIGYELAENMAITLNAFDITIDGPIVYTFDPAAGGEIYQNFASTGTRGAEVEARIKDAWGSISIGYSFASAEGKNRVPLYQAGDVVDVMRAMPGHKLTALGIFYLTKHISVSPSLVYMSERYGYLGNPDVPVGRVPPTALVNVYAQVTDAYLAGLDLGVGVYNLLDTPDLYIQPYDGGHGPLPAPSREVMARATYRFGL